MTPLPPRGLYAITSAADTDPDRLVSRVGAAIDGGAVMIQYRAKDRTDGERRTAAPLLLDFCRARRVPLIVNDAPVLAAEIGADGVHVGRDDGDVRSVRRIVGGPMHHGRVLLRPPRPRARRGGRRGDLRGRSAASSPRRPNRTRWQHRLDCSRTRNARLDVPIARHRRHHRTQRRRADRCRRELPRGESAASSARATSSSRRGTTRRCSRELRRMDRPPLVREVLRGMARHRS